MTSQQQMKALLQKSGIPAKEINVYGSQIMITCWSRDAAQKWAALVSKFAKVRGIVESRDEDQDQARFFAANPGLVMSKKTHQVWRVGAFV